MFTIIDVATGEAFTEHDAALGNSDDPVLFDSRKQAEDWVVFNQDESGEGLDWQDIRIEEV